MELSELDPGTFRKLTVWLVGEEQFRLDPAGSVLKTFDWLNRVITDEEGQLSPQQNAEIRQLAALIEKRGLPAISAQLKVSTQTIRTWLRGTQPGPANIEKLKAFLAQEAASPSPAAAAGAEQPAQNPEWFADRQAATPEAGN
jgi:hypothetical protein